MPFDYDMLIAGAGPAGCAAAYDLAHAGKLGCCSTAAPSTATGV